MRLITSEAIKVGNVIQSHRPVPVSSLILKESTLVSITPNGNGYRRPYLHSLTQRLKQSRWTKRKNVNVPHLNQLFRPPKLKLRPHLHLTKRAWAFIYLKSAWINGVLASCLLSQKVKTMEFAWSHLHTGCFMEGLTVKCKRLIRCFLVPCGSYGAYAIYIWSGMRRSNKTEGIMLGVIRLVPENFL